MPRLAIALAVVALLAAEVATGARQPTAAERTKIVRAIKEEIETGPAGNLAIKRIRVLDIDVSTVNPRFAAAGVRMWDETGQEVEGAEFVLQRGYLTGRWLVRNAGTLSLGCGIPRAVRRDLKLSCP
jgi:hypothetical protein